MKKLIFLALAALVMAGCKTTKVVPTTENNTGSATPLTVAAVAQRQADWTTLKCGGHIDFEGSGKSLGSNMQMRMERGKSIYISMRPALGIEAARMVITDSTVLIVDKLHRRYIKENVSLLTAGVPVTVAALQDIFLGRVHVLGIGTLNGSNIGNLEIVASDDEGSVAVPREQFKGFNYQYAFDVNGRVKALQVKPTTTSRSTTYAANYLQHSLTKAGPVATSLDISTNIAGLSLTLSLDYDDLKWNEAVEIPNEEPKGYKRYGGRELLKLLGQ